MHFLHENVLILTLELKFSYKNLCQKFDAFPRINFSFIFPLNEAAESVNFNASLNKMFIYKVNKFF